MIFDLQAPTSIGGGQLTEQMNKSVVSAKANIAAFIEQRRLALKSLKGVDKECTL